MRNHIKNIFHHNGIAYVASKQVDFVKTCTGCAFADKKMKEACNAAPCLSQDRPDGLNVIYKEQILNTGF